MGLSFNSIELLICSGGALLAGRFSFSFSKGIRKESLFYYGVPCLEKGAFFTWFNAASASFGPLALDSCCWESLPVDSDC